MDVALALRGLLPAESVLSRPIDLLARSVDASIYRIVPQVVVRPRDVGEVRALLAFVRENRRHLTFRTAGTSLSGQALSDDILVELAPHWGRSEVLDGGRRVWAQPGVVGGYLNLRLASHGYRLGPDPASIDAAMMGGILSNNSSGMCCGVAQNSYHTLESLTFVLADGTVVDTAQEGADEALRRARPDLCAALLRLRDDVRADTELFARIRRKFALKQTTGYSLNALLDYETPADILAHLMVGAQGTLGFVAGMTLRTVPEPPARATALLYFAELHEAGAAVAPLAAAGAAALEIMDAASLRSQAAARAYPFSIEDRTAALLVEFREADESALAAALERGGAALSGARLLVPAAFTRDRSLRDEHWRLRKGLFPSVGAMRASGTAVVIEDVVVPVERLAEAVGDLQALFVRHGFQDAIVFGHARDGNLHFVFARDFAHGPTVARYEAFMQGLVDVIVGKYDGALKAEHGSGRNMAPFVRDEWGEAGWTAMRRLKDLLDPQGVLNPDVVLTDNPRLHLLALKPLPTISPLADRCIECGFCEPRCPSRTLTLSPRQRISVVRELVRLDAEGTPAARAMAASLRRDFEYEGVQTCAGDSMCQVSCPVDIDTGALIKELKGARHGAAGRRLAGFLARHFRWVSASARSGLRAARIARRLPGGARVLSLVTRGLHALAPALVPHVPPSLVLPGPADPLPRPAPGGAEGDRVRVVYFPSCLSRMIGALPGEEGVSTPRAVLDALQAAGREVVVPRGLAGLCCGMTFSSKAYFAAAREAAEGTADALWDATREGRDPVVTDASPCALTLADLGAAALAARGRTVRTYDFATYWAREVLPGLSTPPQVPGRVILHPTCTLVKAGAVKDLLEVARAHAGEAVVPPAAECCGFAGDRGFLVPELTASATRREADEVRAIAGDGEVAGFYSTARTCEIGLTRATARPFQSIAHLVREAMRRG